MKIVINTCVGEFDLSSKVWNEYTERTGKNFRHDKCNTEFRSDPVLIEILEPLSNKDGVIYDPKVPYSSLKIVEIPDDVKWEIENYDGSEWVSEIHRTWS